MCAYREIYQRRDTYDWDHMIKAWSKTQNSISSSSAEAELIAMVKLSTELLGLMNLARDLNCRLHGRVWADSSAALAVVKRQGAGRLRHINISLLWVQEQETLKKLYYEKVPGQDNPADLFTKGVGREKLQQFAWASSQVFLDGRAEAGLQVQGAGLLTVGIGSVPSGAFSGSGVTQHSIAPIPLHRTDSKGTPTQIQEFGISACKY